MKFEIKCSTFVRLASICSFFEPTTSQELRDKLSTVRLEAANGKVFAIATNQQIAAIELIGHIPQGNNGVAHVILDPLLMNQCKAEAFIDGMLTINTIPEIATAMAATTSGWALRGNACHWFDETEMNDWRQWFPDEMPTKSQFAMAWDLYHVQALMEASPSGKVIFPQYIDASQPVVLRDRNSVNWVGLFVPKPSNTELQKVGAEMPDWFA